MARYALIDGYLDTMRSRMGSRRDLEDLVAEMEDHLYSTTEQMLARGTDVIDAQRDTLARFGDPRVLTTAYASNPRGGIAMPTKFTRRAGMLGFIAAALWTIAAFLQAATDSSDDWQLYYSLFTLAVVSAGVLTMLAMAGLGKRVGGLGPVGMIGMVIGSLGVLLSVVAWAMPLWMGLEGIGLLLIGIAVLRSETILPRTSVVLTSAAFLIGPITFIVVNLLELGWRDSYGDYPLAWIIGTAVGVILIAVGLLGVGRWLRGEEPVELRSDALAA